VSDAGLAWRVARLISAPQSLAQPQFLDNLYRRRKVPGPAAMFVSEQSRRTITCGRTGCRRFLPGMRDPLLWMVAPFDSASFIPRGKQGERRTLFGRRAERSLVTLLPGTAIRMGYRVNNKTPSPWGIAELSRENLWI
jgi:hypothetical protein